MSKINMFKGITAIVLAGVTLVTCTSCSKKISNISLSPEEVLELSVDDTILDEVREENPELLKVNHVLFDEDLDIISATEKLENYLETIDCLSDVDFSGVYLLDSLTEEQKEKALSLSKEEIDSLMEDAQYNGNDIQKVEKKLLALKTLYYLYRELSYWVNTFGLDTTIQYLMAIIKGAVGDACDVDSKDYSTIKICGQPSYYDEEQVYTVSVGNTIYVVKSGAIMKAIKRVHSLQNFKDYLLENGIDESSDLVPSIVEALEIGDETMVYGACVENGNQLRQKNTKSYVKGKLNA